MILSIEKTRTDRHCDNMINFVIMLEHSCDSVIFLWLGNIWFNIYDIKYWKNTYRQALW